MGNVKKGVSCSIAGCNETAKRSISRDRVTGAGMTISNEGRRVYLCQAHYKQWKKGSKQTRELDRARYT